MIKWVYNLGKVHERRRIKLLIAEELNRVEAERMRWEQDYRLTDNVKNKAKLDKLMAVNEKVQAVLNSLTEPMIVQETTTSRLDNDQQ